MAEKLSVLSRLGYAFNRCNFPSFCLKPLQVKCFEYLLKGKDIVAVLTTGFGKSLLLMCVHISNHWRLFRLFLSADKLRHSIVITKPNAPNSIASMALVESTYTCSLLLTAV